MKLSRRQFLQWSGSAALVVTAGCDALPGKALLGLAGKPERTGPFQPPAAESIDLIAHALNRLSFGPCPGEYARVKKLGHTPEEAVHAYLEEQLNAHRINDDYCTRAVRRFDSTLNEPLGELFEYQEKFLLGEMTRAAILRATFTERQLYEVMPVR